MNDNAFDEFAYACFLGAIKGALAIPALFGFIAALSGGVSIFWLIPSLLLAWVCTLKF